MLSKFTKTRATKPNRNKMSMHLVVFCRSKVVQPMYLVQVLYFVGIPVVVIVNDNLK